MKIHYIITSLEGGGAEFAMPNIINELRFFGNEVDVTALEARDLIAAPLLEKENIPYRLLSNERINIIETIYSVIKILKEKKPDIIWTSLSRASTVGQICGKILNIPVVTWKHSVKKRLSITAGKKLPSLWIADSSYVDHFLKNDMKIPSEKIMTWPLYIARSHTTEHASWDGQNVLNIGTSGRLHKMKNYPFLLKSLALFCSRHPQWAERVHLTIAGEGPQRSELESIIRDYKLEKNVVLLGYITDISSFLKKLNVYVQPSNYEGMCLAAHEAMAAGLPIIATPVGELFNSVQDNINGFVLDKDEGVIETFCEKLEYIFENPKCLKSLGANSQKYVFSHFSHEQYSSRCKEILEKISLIVDKNKQSKN